MSKYIRFIIFFAILGVVTSIFIGTDFAEDFYSIDTDTYSDIKFGDKVFFGTDITGKLYFFDDGLASFSAQNSEQQIINIHYCKSDDCLIDMKYDVTQSVNSVAKRSNDFSKTNKVTFTIPTYSEVFDDYNFSYIGWKVQLGVNTERVVGCADFVFIPILDGHNQCNSYDNTTISWYKYNDIDVSKNKLYYENYLANEKYDNSEAINFKANAGDKVLITTMQNSKVIFFVDGKHPKVTEYTNDETAIDSDLKLYELEIASDGEHSLRIVVGKDPDFGEVEPYVYVKDMRVLSIINKNEKLEERGLKDGEKILELFNCGNNYIYEATGVYQKKK